MKIRVTVLEAGAHGLRIQHYDRSVKGAIAGQPLTIDLGDGDALELLVDSKHDVTLTEIEQRRSQS